MNAPDAAAEHREHCANARLAGIAKANALWGGASAMTLAKRIDRMFPRRTERAQDVVSYVYAHYNGRSASARDYDWVECRECGTRHVGPEAARQCCATED